MLKFYFIACLLSSVFWSIIVDARETGFVDFQKNGIELRLQVNKEALSEVLDQVAAKTGVLIHYSVLPERLVSAICIGSSVKTILDCLLGGVVDMVFRYPEGGAASINQLPVEVWVLGSSLRQASSSLKQCAKFEEQSGLLQQKRKVISVGVVQDSLQEKLDFRLQMAASNKPSRRAQAISYLALHASLENKEVSRVIEEALTDESADVRAQAISARVRRQGEQASITELQQAMQDTEVVVRISALQQLKEVNGLIEQALNDENQSVRQLAEMKLQAE